MEYNGRWTDAPIATANHSMSMFKYARMSQGPHTKPRCPSNSIGRMAPTSFRNLPRPINSMIDCACAIQSLSEQRRDNAEGNTLRQWPRTDWRCAGSSWSLMIDVQGLRGVPGGSKRAAAIVVRQHGHRAEAYQGFYLRGGGSGRLRSIGDVLAAQAWT